MKKLMQKVYVFVVLTITTMCGLSAQDVLNETFENGFEPNGWTQYPTSAPAPWTIGSSGIGGVTPYQGSNMAKLYSASLQDSVRLISKSLDVSGVLEPTLEFYIASPKFNTALTGDSLRVYVEEGTTWRLAQTYVTNSAAWQKKSIRIKDRIQNPTTIRIAFQWVYGNGKGIALDNILVYGKKACSTPVNLRARNVKGDAASLMWSTSQYATSNRIKVFSAPVADASQIETAAALIDTTSQFPVYEATGLTPETTYYWYTKSTCSAVDISEWSSVGEFKTSCATQTIPSGINNFDSYTTGTMPTCWSSLVDLVGEWAGNTSIDQFTPKIVDSQSSNEGGKSLSISSSISDGNSTVVYAVSPRFNVTSVRTYQLRFKLKSPSVSHVLSVGAMTDGHVQTSFSKIKDVSVAVPDIWQDVTVYLSTAAANAEFFAFKVDGSDQQDDIFFVDELEILELPACATPISVVSSNHTLNSVDLSWDGNAANYEIKAYGTPSNPATDAPVASAQNVTSPHTLTGLQPSNSYYVYIKGACNGEWSSAIVVATAQQPAALPFFEDFESNLPPWDLSNGDQANKWHIGSAVNNGGSKSMYISHDGGTTNDYNKNIKSYVYAKRLFSLTAGKAYACSFDWKCMGDGKRDGGMVFLVPADKNPQYGRNYGMLGVNPTVPAGWILLADILSEQQTWKTELKDNFNIPTTGDYYLTFLWKNDVTVGTPPALAIDNVRFEESTCASARRIEVKAITDNSVTLVWSPATLGNPTQYSVYVVPAGTTNYTTATPVTTADTTLVVTGLSQIKAYDVYIVTNCSGSNGNSGPASAKFTTKQTPSVIPYTEGFEAATTSVYLENGDQTNKWIVGSADHNGTGSKSMYISKDGSTREYDLTKKSVVYAYATFSLNNAETYELKLDWKSYGEQTNDILNVFLIPDEIETVVAGNANSMNLGTEVVPAGWKKIANRPLFSTTTDWHTIDTTFYVSTSGTYKLAFYWQNNASEGNSSGAAAIDNISLKPQSCSKPNNVKVEPTDNSLNISWPAASGTTSWNIAVVTANTAATAFINVTTPAYVFTNATPNTLYDIYVYADCGGTNRSDTTKLTTRTLATLPFSTDFEDTTRDQNWSFSSSGSNKWTIGSDANNGGSRGMYVSDNGVLNRYAHSSSVSYAYILFGMEQGANYSIEYDWKGLGESTSDYLRAFLIPESYTEGVAAGNLFGISGISATDVIPANWVPVSRRELSLSGQWQRVNVTATVAETGRYYLAFLWVNDGSGGDQPPAAIDNVGIYKVLCNEVTNVRATNLSETGATVSWNASGESANYDVKVSTTQINPETTNGDIENFSAITVNSVDLAGALTQGTSYYIYVRANCSNGSSGRYTSVKFSTLCNVKNIPYAENFESYDNTQKPMPSCWLPFVYKSDANLIIEDLTPFVDVETGTEPKCITLPAVYKATENVFGSSFAILPRMAEPINSTMISFKAKAKTGTGKISIGVVTDVSDAPTTFTRLAEYSVESAQMQNFTITLDGYSGGANAHIAFAVEGDKMRMSNSVSVDDVKVEAINRCATPLIINHNSVGANSATLKWKSIYATARTYQVIVSTENVGTDYERLNSLTPAQTAFNQSVTGDSVVITGLSPSTKYYYYIRMVCESGTFTAWYDQTKTFTTSCLATDLCKLSIKTTDGNGNGWREGAMLAIYNSESTKLGEYMVTKTGAGGVASDTLGLDSLMLCQGDYIAVYTPSESENAFHGFELKANDISFYNSGDLTLNGLSIKFTLQNGCVASICLSPDNFAIVADATTASATWEGNADSYEIKVYENSGAINPDDPAYTPIFTQSNITTNSVDITGLTPTKKYAAFIRSVCGSSANSGTSLWKLRVFETRLDMPTETLPFATGFEDVADNNKWLFSNLPESKNSWIIDTAVYKEGNRSLYISESDKNHRYNAERASYSYAIRKFSMNSAKSYLVDFDWLCKGEAHYDLARAFIIPAATANIANGYHNGMTFTTNTVPQGWIAASDMLTSVEATWKHSSTEVAVPADGEYFFVLFWKNSASVNRQPPAAIDNLNISVSPCSTPRSLTLSNINANTVDVAWIGSSDNYTVRVYKTDNDTIDPNIHTNHVVELTNIATTSTTVTGLTGNTAYYLFVRGICGTNSSRWTKIKFRTKMEIETSALPLVTNFEQATDNAKWIFSVGQPNRWVIGNNVNNGGSQAMYISDSESAPFENKYKVSEAKSYSYAFRKVELLANNIYSLSFDWRSKGEARYDLGRVFLIPESEAASLYVGNDHGMAASNNTAPENWLDIGGQSLSENLLAQNDTWQTVRKDEVMVPTTGDYLLTFFWKNDAAGGDQPPMAIDNVSFAPANCTGAVKLTLSIGVNTITANWIGSPGSYAVNLFNYEENLNVETATPIQSATVTSNNHTFNGITSGAYIVAVRGICGATNTEWKTASIAFVETDLLPISTDFQNPIDNAKWKFSHNSAAVNKWVIGNAIGNADSKALYISNNNGDDNAYSTNVAANAYAYRTVHLEAGKKYMSVFDWKAAGESNYDYLRAFIVPYSADIESGGANGINISNTPAGWIDIANPAGKMNLSEVWKKSANPNISVSADGVYKIAFFWKNDAGGGTQPPAAIDNFHFKETEIVNVADKACVGGDYTGNHFNIPADSLQSAGVYNFTTSYNNPTSGYQVIKLTLTVAPNTMRVIDSAVCAGTQLEFFGKKIVATASRTYDHYTYSISTGCDSVIRLNLTVNPSYTTTTNVEVTSLPATVGNRTFPAGYPNGEYTVTVPGTTASGCDSTTTYNVKIDVPVGLNGANVSGLTIAPNPIEVGQSVEIRSEFSPQELNGLKVEVLNTAGSVLSTVMPKNKPIRIGGFRVSGVYVIRLTTGTGNVVYGKVIVK